MKHTPYRRNARPARHETTRDPRLNAAKHGMHSDALLLPGEDAAEFQEMRFDLLQSYQPRTRQEGRCVEEVALHEWRKARCRRWEAQLNNRLDALHGGHPGAPHRCDNDPHRWMHHSTDCARRESVLKRLLARAQARLLGLLKQRRQNLISAPLTPRRTGASWNTGASRWRISPQRRGRRPSPRATPRWRLRRRNRQRPPQARGLRRRP